MNKKLYNVHIFYRHFDSDVVDSVVFIVGKRERWRDTFSSMVKLTGRFTFSMSPYRGPSHGFIFALGDEIPEKDLINAVANILIKKRGAG